MSNELEKLRTALDGATPAPDPERRSASLAEARAAFATHQEARQGSSNPVRHTFDRRWSGLVEGVKYMFANQTPRAFLVGSTAIVAVALFALVPVLRDGPPQSLMPNEPSSGLLRSEADLVGSATEQAPVVLEEMESDAPVVTAQPAPQVELRLRQGKSAARSSDLYSEESVTSSNSAPLEQGVRPEGDTEVFSNAAPDPLKVTVDEPVSTFSIDVDTASYAVVRSSLMLGQLPPPDAVRVEEMVNYFPYNYPAPASGEAFRPTVSVVPTPWNDGTRLVHVAIQGALPDIETRPPLNLVFLIDTSGSMNEPNKLPLLVQSFRLLLGQLRPEDEVAIVTYAGRVGLVLQPTPASDKSTILAALDRLQAGGSTAGQAGLQQAYATAATMVAEGEVSRVILATDGDFNVGLSDPEALKRFIAEKREDGTYLSVLGFGRGNLDDATMQALAQNGNGQAAYIDTLGEAQKVLVDQLTGALFPIANDVKIQVEFNPAKVVEYRLIGYETRRLRREDFNNDRIDAGDIGAGHSVTAIYEVTPSGSPARRTDPLRYGSTSDIDTRDGEFGWLKMRYKVPGESESKLIETPILPDAEPAGDLAREVSFAIAIAGFGQLLRDPAFLGTWSWDQAIALASANVGADPFGYRSEAIRLMRIAKSLETE